MAAPSALAARYRACASRRACIRSRSCRPTVGMPLRDLFEWAIGRSPHVLRQECTKLCETVGRMKLRLDYGSNGLLADFPDHRTTVIEPFYLPAAADVRAALVTALRNPAGKRPIRELVRSGQKIAISVC